MKIDHHLDSATIMAYAAGDLDEAFSLVVAAHLAMCDTCRAAVRHAEEMGAVLMEDDTAALNDDAFDRLMGALGDEKPMPAKAHVPAGAVGGEVPYPLQRVLGSTTENIRWRRIAPGVRKADLSAKVGGSSLYMLEIAPGMAVPEHGHGGSELTLVLKGAYRDRFGRFGPGDVADHDEDIEHQPIVEDGAPCICIVAADALPRYKSVLNRILQPIVGM